MLVSARGLAVWVLVSCCAVVGMLGLGNASAWAAAPEAPQMRIESHAATSAQVSGTLAPNGPGQEGTYEFVYAASSTTCSGESKARRGLSLGLHSEEVKEELSGLAAHTTYSVCLLDRNLAGEEALSAPATFTTSFQPQTPETGAAGAITSASAMLHGTLNPTASREEEPGAFEFLYRRSSSECEGEGSTGQIAAATGKEKEAVQAEATGLAANAQYTVCLRAWNTTGQYATGAPVTFTTPSAKPTVGEASFSEAGPTGATVSAPVQEGGLATSYVVQYGPTAAYGSETAPTTLPLGVESTVASAHLAGLTPNTEYHFRVVASNADGESESADGAFTTWPPGFEGLPDDRVYEKVSSADPEEKNISMPFVSSPLSCCGFDGIYTKQPFQVANNGNAIAYAGEPTSPGGTGWGGLGAGNQYLAVRSAEGSWHQVNLQPPGHRLATYEGFAPELTTAYLVAPSEGTEGQPGFLPPLAPGVQFEVWMLYSRPLQTESESYLPFFTTPAPNRHASELVSAGVPKRDSFTSHLIYAGGSADGSHVLFEANDALTPGAEPGEGGVNNLFESVDGQLTLVNVLPGGGTKINATFGGRPHSGNWPNYSRAISEDGTRIFWTDLNTGAVYEREDGTTTVQVSAGSAEYWTATPDGRFAFYTENGQLWRFDTQDSARERLSSAAEASGVVGVSDDGEYVYFVAGDQLGGHGSGGAPNLYLWHAGTTTFIATLEGSDLEGIPPFSGPANGAGDLQPAPARHTAEVTPSGEDILFMSTASLTGYDNRGDSEVYRYSAREARLLCVSCDRSGEPPPPSEFLGPGRAAAYLPVLWNNAYVAHWMSDDGSRVFFDADVPLVPHDTNAAQDVYEWERDGAGSCNESAGCVYLLSDGINASASWLIGGDGSGRDAFFVTRAKLTPEDGGEVDVLYDARAGGVRPPTPPQCSGTGCQGVPVPPPIFATPPSVTFEGVGNFPPTAGAAAKTLKSKPATRAQRLRAALRTCKRLATKKERRSCRARAEKRYGAKGAATRTNKSIKGRK